MASLCISSLPRTSLAAAAAASGCSPSSPRCVSFPLSFRQQPRALREVSSRRPLGISLERCFKRLSIRADAEGGDGAPAGPTSPTSPPTTLRKKNKLSVKTGRKQRVVLRFLWLEKNIGIALDQVVPGHGILPLSPYFFWPRKDAWEELKAKLDSKKWISRKTTIILLNQATDIINLWQQNATDLGT